VQTRQALSTSAHGASQEFTSPAHLDQFGAGNYPSPYPSPYPGPYQAPYPSWGSIGPAARALPQLLPSQQGVLPPWPAPAMQGAPGLGQPPPGAAAACAGPLLPPFLPPPFPPPPYTSDQLLPPLLPPQACLPGAYGLQHYMPRQPAVQQYPLRYPQQYPQQYPSQAYALPPYAPGQLPPGLYPPQPYAPQPYPASRQPPDADVVEIAIAAVMAAAAMRGEYVLQQLPASPEGSMGRMGSMDSGESSRTLPAVGGASRLPVAAADGPAAGMAAAARPQAAAAAQGASDKPQAAASVQGASGRPAGAHEQCSSGGPAISSGLAPSDLAYLLARRRQLQEQDAAGQLASLTQHWQHPWPTNSASTSAGPALPPQQQQPPPPGQQPPTQEPQRQQQQRQQQAAVTSPPTVSVARQAGAAGLLPLPPRQPPSAPQRQGWGPPPMLAQQLQQHWVLQATQAEALAAPEGTSLQLWRQEHQQQALGALAPAPFSAAPGASALPAGQRGWPGAESALPDASSGQSLSSRSNLPELVARLHPSAAQPFTGS
jgi:hypothetical protein